jgi:hypothetical protein
VRNVGTLTGRDCDSRWILWTSLGDGYATVWEEDCNCWDDFSRMTMMLLGDDGSVVFWEAVVDCCCGTTLAASSSTAVVANA